MQAVEIKPSRNILNDLIAGKTPASTSPVSRGPQKTQLHVNSWNLTGKFDLALLLMGVACLLSADREATCSSRVLSQLPPEEVWRHLCHGMVLHPV